MLKAALGGKITNAQGALAMQLSVRQFQRVKVRFAAEGVGGLRHRLGGRPSPRRLAAGVRAQATALLPGPYAGLNDCHVTEKLQLNIHLHTLVLDGVFSEARRGQLTPNPISAFPRDSHVDSRLMPTHRGGWEASETRSGGIGD